MLRRNLRTSCKTIYFVVFYNFFYLSNALLCYNGTLSNVKFGEDPLQRKRIFISDSRFEARLRCSLTILCPDNAVCFFRSWVARSKHAWIVQRGCYELSTEESPPISLSVISRSMSCKRQRFPDAEYKVCFCQGDRCNGSIDLCLNYPKGLLFLLFVLHLFFYISSLQ
ncbi:unnamed protein product [Parnassius mnemosyne]|uniref:Protein quiver n=1 Tax=Parnassius mnemosyne TaxID=213953 RepID=A0AAV1M1P1_9NEOP